MADQGRAGEFCGDCPDTPARHCCNFQGATERRTELERRSRQLIVAALNAGKRVRITKGQAKAIVRRNRGL